MVEITCQYCCVPFRNGSFWKESGRVVAYSETGALCQSNRNYLWTEVYAHPKEQVIEQWFCFCLSLLTEVEGKNGRTGSLVQAMLDCKQRWGPGRLFVHHCKMLAHASALAPSRKWLVPAKFWSRSFPQWTKGLDWNFGTSHLGVVLLLENAHIKWPLFQPDSRS